MYLIPLTTSIAVFKKNIAQMHIYHKHLNKIDVNSESD